MYYKLLDLREGNFNISTLTTNAIVSLGCCLLMTTSAQAQVVLNPDNGHFYEVVSAALSWTQARDAAQARTFNGLQGYLATVTSSSENSFIVSLGNTDSKFLGGFQDTTAPDFSEPEGGWRWITGEAWNFTSWAPPEPNNSTGMDNFLHYSQGAGNWNDVDDSYLSDGYIVEYGSISTTAAPDASTLALFLMGAGVSGVYQWKNKRLNTKG